MKRGKKQVENLNWLLPMDVQRHCTVIEVEEIPRPNKGVEGHIVLSVHKLQRP
jgi:hypothetical protein